MTKRWTALSESEIAEKSAANRAARKSPYGWSVDPFKAMAEAPKPKPKKPAKTRQKVPTEHQEQADVIRWFDRFAVSFGLDSRILFAIPNGSHKSMHQAAKFKAEGLRPGVPDLFLAKGTSNYLGLFIEMKRTKGSVTSDDQYHMLNQLNRNGYRATICKGHNDAINAIKDYLR